MKAKAVLRPVEGIEELQIIGYKIICLGCDEEHLLYTNPSYGDITWGFNGDIEKPTFNPSLLIRTGCHISNHKTDHCWCTYNKECIEKGEKPTSFKCKTCHTFITDGKIQYLTDCSHKLAGQTIELPNFEE